MDTALIKGESMVIIAEGKAIGCARTCSLNTKVNIIGKSTLGSGAWKEFKAVSKEWSMTADGLCKIIDSTNNTYPDLNVIKNAMAEVLVGFTVSDIAGATYNQYGKGIIVELNASGSVNNVAVFSVTIQGTGEIAQFPAPLIISVVVTVDEGDPSVADAVVTFSAPVREPLSYTIEYGLVDTIIGTHTGVTYSPDTFDDEDIDDIHVPGTWFRIKAIYSDGESEYSEKIYPNT